MDTGHTWALVLAAGEGTRLRSLTTTATGVAVPKQFCSLDGGLSLLNEALLRAEAVATRRHICTVVAAEHQDWWSGPLQGLPAANVIVQPRNCGTANGILLPLLHILERDPCANIVLLPSDHHVRHEAVLAQALQLAKAQLRLRKRELVLLGIEPDEVDPELGYIVPGSTDGHGGRFVERFVEKPASMLATDLIASGALWNAFIVVARAQALLDLFSLRMPQIVNDMRAVVVHDAMHPDAPVAANRLYRTLPNVDFSRHVIQGYEFSLRVLAVPSCGWSDLGTPSRVARTLQGIPAQNRVDIEALLPLRGHLSLARQHALLQSS
jgi:mannose-1-phosphate guanylyltransferase